MRIAFLFGAGASKAAGLPGTSDITKAIRSGQYEGTPISKHSDGRYFIGKPQCLNRIEPDRPKAEVLAFIDIIVPIIDDYYSTFDSSHITTYEDIFYVAEQIHDSLSIELDNPAISLLEKLLFENRILFPDINESQDSRERRLMGISGETTNYILCTASNLLYSTNMTSKHLQMLKECLHEYMIDIYTLNHDLVVENFLENAAVQYIDGFRNPTDDGTRYWDPITYDQRIGTDGLPETRLYKLHGSIDWYSLPEGVVIPPRDSQWWNRKDAKGNRRSHYSNGPLILIGTFNKYKAYLYEVFMELQYRFIYPFNKVQTLIVCGYSFGDQGINARIVRWLRHTENNRVIIIHPRPDGLKERARSGISRRWDFLINSKKLEVIPKGIEEVKWDDIRPLL